MSAGQDLTIPTASLLDSARFTLFHAVPMYLQGPFTRNRFWVTVISALHPDPLSVRFLSRLRRKYNSDYLYVSVGRTTTLLVFDERGIRRILENSPAQYAETEAKRRGMSRFQPEALTVSREPIWQQRRRFNEEVLDSSQPIHRDASHFLAIVRNETRPLLRREQRLIKWQDVERLFERLTLSVLFGRAAVDDVFITRSLTRLMRNGNRARFCRPNRVLFDSFYTAVRGYVRWPNKNSLAARCREAGFTNSTRVENQITHWMFAMNETLAINTARALAIIAADPAVQDRIAAEIAGVPIDTPDGINQLMYLEGCLQEAMRLWPTTPSLVRQSLMADELEGRALPARTSIMILNSFLHRDRQADDTADQFKPEAWRERLVNYRLNHLSNGSQICAGRNLALFLGKAVLASLCHGQRYKLVRPKLNPRAPLPHAMNFYRTCIERLE